MSAPAALIFDVFGTCVDWRESIARQVAVELPGLDPHDFADVWRAGYQPAMAPIRDGRQGYTALDDLHRTTLSLALEHFGAEHPDPQRFARAWERLDPWPDVVPGLAAMGKRAIVAPCSNGSIALMTRLARHAGLPWDCILGADIAQDYKPKAEVYLASARALRLAPEQVMMVAAHNGDLAAARAAGLQTGFVARPREHGAGQSTDLVPSEAWDVIAPDFIALADRLFG